MLKYLLLLLICSCTYQTDITEEEMTQNPQGKVLTASGTPTLFVQQNPALVVGLQTGMLDPGEYTLQFGLIPPAGGVGVDNEVSARAIITWKTDSQQQRRVISIIPGAAISAPCESVDVIIEDLGTLFGPNVVGQSYKVPITLSRGSRANIQQPPVLLTGPARTLNFGTSILFDVPKDSGVVAIHVLAGRVAAPPNPIDIVVSQNSNAVRMGLYYPLLVGGWVPLLPGVSQIEVFNNSVASPVLAQVVWGVEG